MSPTENPATTKVAQYYSAAAHANEFQPYADPRMSPLYTAAKKDYQAVLRGRDVLEIAGGDGYWAKVVAETARSVLVTDRDPVLVAMIREKLASFPHVRCQVADAYSLDDVSGRFTAAFAQHWWSHVPRSDLRSFLRNLHSRLEPGSVVMFLDSLPYEWDGRRWVDDSGDQYEERSLRSGKRFAIVKNFPTEQEIKAVLEGIAESVRYTEYSHHSWSVQYSTA